MDIHVVTLNETDDYYIDPADVEYITQIRGVYFFDQEQVVHYDKAPSYYLVHLYNRVILSEAGDALNENQKKRLYRAYEYNSDNGGENVPVHCDEIDAINPDCHYACGDWTEDIEVLKAHLCASCPL